MTGLENLLTPENAMLAGGIVALLGTAKRMFPKKLESYWGKRILPVAPLVLGIVGALLGAGSAEGTTDQVLLGLVAGWAASNTYKVWKTSVRAKGLEK